MIIPSLGIQTNSSRHVGGVCFSLNVPTQMAVSKPPDAKLGGRRNKLKPRLYKRPSPYTSLIILS
ncbi:hypothetical protein, partial [Moorena bouillonii]|uniref:hypothetical protein n=1 Tax=Moorena bouillonii TaxID=207920 RepID=UPI001BE0D408